MTSLEKYRKALEGRVLTALFFTKPSGPYDYCLGLSAAYYFSTVMELDNRDLFLFDDTTVERWVQKGELILLTHKNWNLARGIVFENQKIQEISQGENGELTFILQNQTIIYHSTEYGDKLFIELPPRPTDLNSVF